MFLRGGVFSLAFALAAELVAADQAPPRRSAASLGAEVQSGSREALTNLVLLAKSGPNRPHAMGVLCSGPVVASMPPGFLTNTIVPLIVDSLRADPSTRRAASIEASKMALHFAGYIPDFTRLISNPEERWNAGPFALELLQKLGPKAESALPTLHVEFAESHLNPADSASDDLADWHERLAEAILSIQKSNDATWKFVDELLGDETPSVQLHAVSYCFEGGRITRETWKAVQRLLQNDDVLLVSSTLTLLNHSKAKLTAEVEKTVQHLKSSRVERIARLAHEILPARTPSPVP